MDFNSVFKLNKTKIITTCDAFNNSADACAAFPNQ